MCCGAVPPRFSCSSFLHLSWSHWKKPGTSTNMIHWVLAMHLPCVWRHESHLQYVWQLKSGSWATRKRVDGAALPDGKCSARPRGECLGTEPDTHEGSAWVSHLVEVLPRWFRSKGWADGVSGHPPDQAGLAQPYIHGHSFLFLQTNYPLQHGRNTSLPPCLGFCKQSPL